jgi:hypothetical protein
MASETRKGLLATRRGFFWSAATVASGTVLATGAGSAAAPKAHAETPPVEGAKKKLIKHILLFMHPPAQFSQYRLLKPNPVVEENWKKVIAENGPDEANVVCIVHSSKRDQALEEVALRHFGDRCIANPRDNSDATRLILAGDLDRTFGKRGYHGEWNPYEIWSSNNARRWVEGFKRRLAGKGYTYDPASVTMETFGNWSGCHHKYSNFMAVYLGMKAPAHIHAETELCSLKSVPMPAHEFVELKAMERHVWLALFRREDGIPMAQFWDGLRPVWEPPHTAHVTMDPNKVDLFTFSPNSLIPVHGLSKKLKGGFIADVGDGTHPAFTTVVARSNKDSDFEELRAALMHAEIQPRDDKRQVSVAVET